MICSAYTTHHPTSTQITTRRFVRSCTHLLFRPLDGGEKPRRGCQHHAHIWSIQHEVSPCNQNLPWGGHRSWESTRTENKVCSSGQCIVLREGCPRGWLRLNTGRNKRPNTDLGVCFCLCKWVDVYGVVLGRRGGWTMNAGGGLSHGTLPVTLTRFRQEYVE